MENRVGRVVDNDRFAGRLPSVSESAGPQPIGEVLAELLAQYQARFPQVRIAAIETPAVAL